MNPALDAKCQLDNSECLASAVKPAICPWPMGSRVPARQAMVFSRAVHGNGFTSGNKAGHGQTYGALITLDAPARRDQ